MICVYFGALTEMPFTGINVMNTAERSRRGKRVLCSLERLARTLDALGSER